MIKTKEEIELLREGGKRLAKILRETGEMVRPGISISELDAFAEKSIREGGDTPALLGYRPRGARRDYPSTICISVNDEVVHGIPTEDPRTIEEGDIVSLDCVLIHKGMYVDSAISVIAGEGDKEAKRLLMATKEAMMAGIKTVRPGSHIGDIGAAVEEVGDKYDYGVVYELGGHGVGHHVHEEPYVPNVGDKGTGPEIVEGMVLAIEPMLTEGDPDVKLLKDGYTFVTRDGSRAAHFEHTVVVTDKGFEIITIE